MLGLSGILAVISDPEVRETSSGSVFVFQAKSPDPIKGSSVYHFYNVDLFVPTSKVSTARAQIIKGNVLQVWHGKWDASRKRSEQYDRDFIVNRVKLTWNNIWVMEWMSGKQKEDKGDSGVK